MTMVRQTKQRAAVIEVLRHSRTHPDAAQIHAEVRQILPQISLATVYRTLDALVKEGMVSTIDRTGQATRYDFNDHDHEHDHYHAVCSVCGAIFDVELETSLEHSLPEVALPKGFRVTEVRLEWIGVCECCAERQDESRSGHQSDQSDNRAVDRATKTTRGVSRTTSRTAAQS